MYNQDFFNRIQMADFFLQMWTMLFAEDSVTNTQLLEELQKQNRDYLEKIVEQNNKILEYLSNE